MTTCTNIEFETTVCGGFPVIVRATIAPAEPDVGIMSAGVDDFELFTPKGRPAPWLQLTNDDRDHINEEALQILMDGGDYDNDY